MKLFGEYVCQAIKEIYPDISSGFLYWESHPETGKPWKFPEDGLVWEKQNKLAKPSWKEIEQKILRMRLEEGK
jgi:hypothetical protein